MVKNSSLSVRECAERIFTIVDRDKRKREIAISTLKFNPIGRRIIPYGEEVNTTPYVLGVRVFNKSLEGRMQDPNVARPFDGWYVESQTLKKIEDLLETKTEINTLKDLSAFFRELGEIVVSRYS